MRGIKRSLQRFWIALAACALAACSSGYAPVTEQSLGGRFQGPTPSTYTVSRGDTLYSIAWRYGLDFRTLARINGIDRRYLIYPGQQLRLKNQSDASRSNSSGTKSARSSQTIASAPPKTSRTPPPAPAVSSGSIKWQWPTQGALIGRYSSGSTPNKGINLAGKVGDPVYAAASGTVVYAGSGLLGYGNLVILNHNRQYLSAYAHNSRILVKESDSVKAGDKIAELGNTGANRPMLHFEIRRDGKPVNPLQYLPKKK
ncbi:peptidoglycan DD-metalloendopeptidase family protein [Marinobacterium sp. YM272]|uniref:peptidoglycan DD-metalloendopeptidase family protein n=1 Tax=Marinobacterium sp. YM272 TaxID=3421654 RepID=UPI003D7F6B7E